MVNDRSSVYPSIRLDDLVITETRSDMLVYDQRAHALHTLNARATSIWRLADGTRSIDDIARESGETIEAVEQTISTLASSNLLQEEVASFWQAPQSRRRALRKAALVAGPVILSVGVPLAQAAASKCGGTTGCPATNPLGQFCCHGNKPGTCNELGVCSAKP